MLGLFVVYELWWTGRETAAAQDTLQDELAEQFDEPTLPSPAASAPAPDTTPELGDALALLYMPALGEEWAVVEGVGRSDLKKGPWALPRHRRCRVRSATSPSRATAPPTAARSRDIGELDTGDRIVAQTASGWFVYQVDDLGDRPSVRSPTSSRLSPRSREPSRPRRGSR